MHELESRLDVGDGEAGLVAIAVVTAVGVGGAGRIVTAGAGAVAVTMRNAVLDVEIFPAWVVHEVALADVDASGVERVLVIVAAVVVVDVGGVVFATAAAAIGGVGVGGACGADDACVQVAAGVAALNGVGVEGVGAGVLHDVGALVVVAYWLAFDTVVVVLVDVAVNLHLL